MAEQYGRGEEGEGKGGGAGMSTAARNKADGEKDWK